MSILEESVCSSGLVLPGAKRSLPQEGKCFGWRLHASNHTRKGMQIRESWRDIISLIQLRGLKGAHVSLDATSQQCYRIVFDNWGLDFQGCQAHDDESDHCVTILLVISGKRSSIDADTHLEHAADLPGRPEYHIGLQHFNIKATHKALTAVVCGWRSASRIGLKVFMFPGNKFRCSHV